MKKLAPLLILLTIFLAGCSDQSEEIENLQSVINKQAKEIASLQNELKHELEAQESLADVIQPIFGIFDGRMAGGCHLKYRLKKNIIGGCNYFTILDKGYNSDEWIP